MGEKSEYSENVPSDLEFLGGGFPVLPVQSLHQITESDSPGLRVVKEALLKTLEFRGADFVVQPLEEYTRVRGKSNGAWRELMRFPAALHKEFTIEVSRLWCRTTSASMMDWRLPFDGVLLLSYPNGDWYDIFVSAVAGVYGFIFKFTFCSREKSFDLDLDKLGFSAVGLSALKQAVDAPKGMVLLSGPTHSGKSIVCYSSVMRRLRNGDSAVAVERPRKFRLPGARQIQLKYGENFYKGVPGALQDDPRVLLVQNLDYYEDAAASFAAAKERLVVAAIHLNDTVFCLRQLHNWAGSDRQSDADHKLIRNFRILLAENLSLVCSGRLVGMLCPHCRIEVDAPAATLERYGLSLNRKGPLRTFDKGRGCENCRGSGILKYIGVYEVLPISPALKGLLAGTVPDCAFYRRAREEGLVSLREAALRLALNGAISIKTAISATPPPYYNSL
jgi:type IV pilus assembly protein PilB